MFHKKGVPRFHTQNLEHAHFLKKDGGDFFIFFRESKNWDSLFVTIKPGIKIAGNR
jgi:hypothetical protein